MHYPQENVTAELDCRVRLRYQRPSVSTNGAQPPGPEWPPSPDEPVFRPPSPPSPEPVSPEPVSREPVSLESCSLFVRIYPITGCTQGKATLNQSCDKHCAKPQASHISSFQHTQPAAIDGAKELGL